MMLCVFERHSRESVLKIDPAFRQALPQIGGFILIPMMEIIPVR